MENSIIFLCTTYYQIIVSIQIRRALYPKSRAAIIISDSSNNSESVCKRIEELHLFDEVYYARNIRENEPNFTNRKNKINRLIQYIIKGSYTSYLKKSYDILFLFNINWYSYILFNALQKDNKDIEVKKFEEGIVSYQVDEHRSDLPFFRPIWRMKRLLRQPLIFDRIKEFYCFFPSFYEGKLIAKEIPRIITEDEEIKNILTFIFDVDTNKITYKEKYIYFSSMIDSELTNNNVELSIIKEVADVVGNDNLLVKLHPREANPQRYRDLGLKIDANSNIPFEIIQLIYDFSNYIFISTLSGSTINMATVIDSFPKVFYTYKLAQQKTDEYQHACDLYDTIINKLIENGMDRKKMFVLKNTEEMRTVLKQ